VSKAKQDSVIWCRERAALPFSLIDTIDNCGVLAAVALTALSIQRPCFNIFLERLTLECDPTSVPAGHFISFFIMISATAGTWLHFIARIRFLLIEWMILVMD
jgi:hypothetical protein